MCTRAHTHTHTHTHTLTRTHTHAHQEHKENEERRLKEEQERKAEQERLDREAEERAVSRKQKELAEWKRIEREQRIESLKMTPIGVRALETITQEVGGCIYSFCTQCVFVLCVGAGKDGCGYYHDQAAEADGEGDEREGDQAQDPGKESKPPHTHTHNTTQHTHSRSHQIDHWERAKRLVEVPLLEKQYQDQVVEDRAFHEQQEEERVAAEIRDREEKEENRERLGQMESSRQEFLEVIQGERHTEHLVSITFSPMEINLRIVTIIMLMSTKV